MTNVFVDNTHYYICGMATNKVTSGPSAAVLKPLALKFDLNTHVQTGSFLIDADNLGFNMGVNEGYLSLFYPDNYCGDVVWEDHSGLTLSSIVVPSHVPLIYTGNP